MKKNSPPKRDYDAEKKQTDAQRAMENAKKKMDEAKKAVDYATALAEKHPKPETLAASMLAVKDYAATVDRFTDSVCKSTDARIVNGNAISRYYEAYAHYRYSQGRKSR